MTAANSGYQNIPHQSAGPASRNWWDENASEYLTEHGDFLGAADFCWCPEGLREEDARLLGNVTDKAILEIGAGAAQCSHWLLHQGGDVVATDISMGMLQPDELQRCTPDGAERCNVNRIQADARKLPFDDASFDIVFTSYGALPFVPDAKAIHQEAARVLRRGGTWVFSVTHPIRWAFPDDPGERGLTVSQSYFDRTPYAEKDQNGTVTYAEFHRTIGDHIRELATSGFRLLDLVEPEWPDGHNRTWGGWSSTRGRLIPGTAIFVAELL